MSAQMLLWLAAAYLLGSILIPLPKRRPRPRVTCEPITQPLPVLPVTAIHGIPLNPLVRS